MKAEIETHIADVDAFYRPIIRDAHLRLSGGSQLLSSFEQSVDAYRKIGRRQVSGIIERVNELTVAHKLLTDPRLASAQIAYEPQIVPGPKFDFVVSAPGKPTLYIEVKTVSPQPTNDATSWQKATYRRRLITPGTVFIVDEKAFGAEIFGNDFAARSSIMKYALQTETKLAAHLEFEPGRGALVICGNGVSWEPDLLEDFADYYRHGRHRADDPFTAMEQAVEANSPKLRRSLEGFGLMIRAQNALVPTTWTYPVTGPLKFQKN